MYNYGYRRKSHLDGTVIPALRCRLGHIRAIFFFSYRLIVSQSPLELFIFHLLNEYALFCNMPVMHPIKYSFGFSFSTITESETEIPMMCKSE